MCQVSGCRHGSLPFRVCADTKSGFNIRELVKRGVHRLFQSDTGVGHTYPREMPARAPSSLTLYSDALARRSQPIQSKHAFLFLFSGT